MLNSTVFTKRNFGIAHFSSLNCFFPFAVWEQPWIDKYWKMFLCQGEKTKLILRLTRIVKHK